MDETLGRYIVYDENDKHFWAAFLNLARHNTFITINHIHERVGLKLLSNDDKVIKSQIKSQWEGNQITDNLFNKQKLLELIKKHFPFLTPASLGYASYMEYLLLKEQKKDNKGKKEKLSEQSEALSFENMKEVFLDFIDSLQKLRNYFSHAEHEIYSIDMTYMLYRLYDIFDANINLVKKDYEVNPDIKFEDFEHLIRKDEKGYKENYRYNFNNDSEDIFNSKGLLFFTSLFLEKKDAIWMQKKMFGFKGGDEYWKKMTNEVFCRSRIKIPKLKLESKYDKDQLLLDLLNELGRCPRAYYDRLKETDKERFQVPIELDDDPEVNDNEEDPYKNILVRHQNRFPYFALRFFDLNECFKDLRFQIDLGSYHYHIYHKIIGDQYEERHMTKKLTSFDRLQYFEEGKQPKEWQDLVKDLDNEERSSTPFISKTVPHYNIDHNRIGLKFIKPNEHQKWPSLETSHRKEGTKEPTKTYKITKEYQPDMFLSTHELVPMMFYYLLTEEETNKSPENIIRETKGRILKVYEDFQNEKINTIEDLEEKLNNTNLKAGHFPKYMLEILKGETRNMAEEAKEKQQKLVEQTENRLRSVDNQLKKKIRLGKRRSGLMRTGVIADWLVEDLLRFQPVAYDEKNDPLPSSKANSTEYQLLQKTFALYGGEKHRLPAYLKQLNLVDSSNPHLFLSNFKWDEQPNILSFYQSYLKARLSFLKNLDPDEWKSNEYFLMLRKPKENRSNLVKGWKEGGLNLPRGVFTKAIREHLSKNEDQEMKSVAENAPRNGFIPKVLPHFFYTNYNDELPQYYNLDFNIGEINKLKNANYKSPEERQRIWKKKKVEFSKATLKDQLQINTDFENLYDNIKSRKTSWNQKKELLKEFFDKYDAPESLYVEIKGKLNLNEIKKRIEEWINKYPSNFRSWKKFEKQLRLYQNQDLLTWLMSRELHRSDLGELNIQDLKLKHLDPDLSQNESGNVLNQIKTMQLPITVHNVNSNNEKDYASLLFTVYIEERNTKILKQGNFKALLKDRRLNNLLSFVEDQNSRTDKLIISKKRLDFELSKYQSLRIDIFEQTLELEKAIINQYPQLPKDKFRTLLIEWYITVDQSNELRDCIQNIIAIRNAFAHNQYPFVSKIKGSFKKFIPDETELQESEGLGIASMLYENLKENIQVSKYHI